MNRDQIRKIFHRYIQTNHISLLRTDIFKGEYEITVSRTAAAAGSVDTDLSVVLRKIYNRTRIVRHFRRGRTAGDDDRRRLSFRINIRFKAYLIDNRTVRHGHARSGIVKPRQGQISVVGTARTEGRSVQIGQVGILHTDIIQYAFVPVHTVLKTRNISKALHRHVQAGLLSDICGSGRNTKSYAFAAAPAAVRCTVNIDLTVGRNKSLYLRSVVGDFDCRRITGKSNGNVLTFGSRQNVKTDLINDRTVRHRNSGGCIVKPRDTQRARSHIGIAECSCVQIGQIKILHTDIRQIGLIPVDTVLEGSNIGKTGHRHIQTNLGADISRS